MAFGPQKGATNKILEALDDGMRTFAAVVKKNMASRCKTRVMRAQPAELAVRCGLCSTPV